MHFSHCLSLRAGACDHFIASFTAIVGADRYCFMPLDRHVEYLEAVHDVQKVPSECYFDFFGGRIFGLGACDTVLERSLTYWAADHGWTHQSFCSFHELVG